MNGVAQFWFFPEEAEFAYCTNIQVSSNHEEQSVANDILDLKVLNTFMDMCKYCWYLYNSI
jgi:hypothetical protein